jgi:hypothetical protein
MHIGTIVPIVRHTFLEFGAIGSDAGAEKRAVSAPPAYHAASAHADAALRRLTVAHVRAFLVSWAVVARAHKEAMSCAATALIAATRSNLTRAVFVALDTHRKQEQDQRRGRQLRRLAQQRMREPLPRTVDLRRFVTAAHKAQERRGFRMLPIRDEGVLLLRLEGDGATPDIAWELPPTEDRLIDIVASVAETLRARQHDATAETLFVIAETAAEVIIAEDS